MFTFLKHIECIKFYELKDNLELLYEILIKNVENVCEKQLNFAKNIVSEIKNLKKKKYNPNAQNLKCYPAYFSRYEKGIRTEESWLIMNMLGDLHATSNRFPEFPDNFGAVPYVGLAARLNSGQNMDEFQGRIFNFLPLLIKTPFRIFIHGQSAVINNRSTFCYYDNTDLTKKSLEVKWNNYFFTEVLPRAWVKFLVKLKLYIKVPQDVSQNDYYNKFWPIPDKTQPMTSSFFIDLLKKI